MSRSHSAESYRNAKRQKTVSPLPSPDSGSREGAVRLLLVEDHAALAEVTAEFLRELGLEVQIAKSGEQALEKAVAFLPDIVLCDMRLPDMSGLDVAGALRANPKTKGVLIALHTAMDNVDIHLLERETHAKAVNLFLSKPITEEKLERLLAELAAKAKIESPTD
jgi:CheY-like chemotaxis protein